MKLGAHKASKVTNTDFGGKLILPILLIFGHLGQKMDFLDIISILNIGWNSYTMKDHMIL